MRTRDAPGLAMKCYERARHALLWALAVDDIYRMEHRGFVRTWCWRCSAVTTRGSEGSSSSLPRMHQHGHLTTGAVLNMNGRTFDWKIAASR